MSFGFNPSRISRAIFRTANIPAAIAILVVTMLGVLADCQNRIVSEQRMRADTLVKLNLIRAKLEGNINGDLQPVRGLVATIATEPRIDQARFAALARNIFHQETRLRDIAGAPNLVVSLLYPVKGNEKALGLDYMANPHQRDGVLRARDTGALVLAGPVDLAQGGRGIIGRFPVFNDADTPRRSFWGVISAVIDVDELYRDSGLLDPHLDLDVALTGIDALGGGGMRFYGPDLRAADPVIASVTLPSGSWQIAAVPRGGWASTPPNAWTLRLLMAAAGLLLVVPIGIAGWLFAANQRNYGELQNSERALRKLSQRLELALDASQIGVWEHNLATNTLIWDDRVNTMYGKPADGQPRSYADWTDAIHPADLPQALSDFETAAREGGIYTSQYRIVLPDGAIRHMRARATIYRDGTEVPKMIGAEWDVTADVETNRQLEQARVLAERRSSQLEKATARIEHSALHDSLTGLPNRRYLDEMLEEAALTCARMGEYVALLQIDLDRFKQINDTLGHAAGDAMLVHTAAVLKASVRHGDFVARVGGDEFVVVCRSDEGATAMAALAERIILEMRRPVPYEGHECRSGVSIGIAMEGGGGPVDSKHLLVNADIALYRAKSRGRNRYEFFTEALQAEIIRNKKLADDILNGLERSEFIAYYQPQFDAHTLELAGVEALARWAHPVEGVLAPDTFLKTAEELNVVASIDRMVLEKAVAQFDAWTAERLPVPRVSVNVSARRLQEEELVEGLKQLKIKPGTVSFELLESIFLDDSDESLAWNVDRIRELGIDIEIDDFGSGYTSIISLVKLQPQRLKIDRQLVMPIVTSERQRHLVESIVEIGRSLGIEVVAEGVETLEHARILRAIGCDKLQGYAFARPMTAQEMTGFIQARSWRKAS